jgi:hypothetical protein
MRGSRIAASEDDVDGALWQAGNVGRSAWDDAGGKLSPANQSRTGEPYSVAHVNYVNK